MDAWSLWLSDIHCNWAKPGRIRLDSGLNLIKKFGFKFELKFDRTLNFKIETRLLKNLIRSSSTRIDFTKYRQKLKRCSVRFEFNSFKFIICIYRGKWKVLWRTLFYEDQDTTYVLQLKYYIEIVQNVLSYESNSTKSLFTQNLENTSIHFYKQNIAKFIILQNLFRLHNLLSRCRTCMFC